MLPLGVVAASLACGTCSNSAATLGAHSSTRSLSGISSPRPPYFTSSAWLMMRGQQSGGGATSVAPAAAPVRGRGAFCGGLRRPTGGWTAPGHRLGRPAAHGRSAADGKRCSGARRADRDNSSVLRRVAIRGAGQPRECGAVAGIGGGCGRGSFAPLPRLMRRSVRRQRTRRVPAAAPQWRPASPARQRRQESHRPRRRPLLRLMRRSVRCQGARRVRAAAPQWRPASPARQRWQGRHRPRRRPRTAAQQQRARPMERHLRERRLPVQRALTAAVEQRWPASRSGFAFR